MRIGDCHKTWELWQQWNVNLEVERQFRKEAQYSIFFSLGWYLKYFTCTIQILRLFIDSGRQSELRVLWVKLYKQFDFELFKVYSINSALKCRQVHQNSKNFPYFWLQLLSYGSKITIRLNQPSSRPIRQQYGSMNAKLFKNLELYLFLQ